MRASVWGSELLFGDANTFAIEIAPRVRSDRWFLGGIQVWIAGEPIGDIGDDSDLPTAARWARQFTHASPRRTRPDLDEASANEAFESLWGIYHSGNPANVGDRDALRAWDRDAHDLTDAAEASLRDRAILLVVRRGDGCDRVISRRFSDGKILEQLVSQGVVDGVLTSFVAYVEQSLSPA